MARNIRRKRIVSIHTGPSGKLNLEEIARKTRIGGLVHPIIDSKSFSKISLPLRGDEKSTKVELKNTAGDVIACYVKRYDRPSRQNSNNTSVLMFSGDYIREAEYEAKQLALWNELNIPSPTYFGIEIDTTSGRRVMDIFMKYIEGPTVEEDFIAIRQEIDSIDGDSYEERKLREYLTKRIKKAMMHMLITNAELQIKGTYTCRSSVGPDPRIDLRSLLPPYDPIRDYKPDYGATKGSTENELEFHIDRRFADPLKYIISFRNPGITPKTLDDKVNRLCELFRPIFHILCIESPRAYSHGDENGNNAKLFDFAKPNQKATVRSIVFDSNKVIMAPAHIGAASYLVNSTADLGYDEYQKLALEYIIRVSKWEREIRGRKKYWDDQELIFEKDKIDIGRELLLMDIAMVYNGIRAAGIGLRLQQNNPEVYRKFITREQEYHNPFFIIPGKRHDTISYSVYDTEDNEGQFGRISKLMWRVNERLSRIVNGKTSCSLDKKEKGLINKFHKKLREYTNQNLFDEKQQ